MRKLNILVLENELLVRALTVSGTEPNHWRRIIPAQKQSSHPKRKKTWSALVNHQCHNAQPDGSAFTHTDTGRTVPLLCSAVVNYYCGALCVTPPAHCLASALHYSRAVAAVAANPGLCLLHGKRSPPAPRRGSASRHTPFRNGGARQPSVWRPVRCCCSTRCGRCRWPASVLHGGRSFR